MFLLQVGLLFGQVNRQQQADPSPAGLLGACACYGFVLLIAIGVQILFLMALSKCLAQCSPRNRTMEPGQVWLNLIPLFGLVWMFITIIRISESLKNEYQDRGIRAEDPEFAKMTGIIYMVLSLIGCGPIGLVFWIIYWVKIVGFKNELVANKGGGGDHRDDDDDDRPRRGGGGRPTDDYDDDDRPRRRPRDDDDR